MVGVSSLRPGSHLLIVVQLLSHVQLFATPIPQHAARPSCPSPSPGVYSHSGPLNRWCHPTISSSVVPFSSCPHSFLASESFPVSQLFASGGQSIEASTSASALPVSVHGWFPLGLTGLISLQTKGLLIILELLVGTEKHPYFELRCLRPLGESFPSWVSLSSKHFSLE